MYTLSESFGISFKLTLQTNMYECFYNDQFESIEIARCPQIETLLSTSLHHHNHHHQNDDDDE